MFKTLHYFGNLAFFATFLYSITKLTDDAPPYLLIMLVLSTIGLGIAFYLHIEGDKHE
jgi:hypothetical protein